MSKANLKKEAKLLHTSPKGFRIWSGQPTKEQLAKPIKQPKKVEVIEVTEE